MFNFFSSFFPLSVGNRFDFFGEVLNSACEGIRGEKGRKNKQSNKRFGKTQCCTATQHAHMTEIKYF